eukprot:TRINITY_DN52555_c0_g1_i1.p2 TRINITY_DN52555_c0_g1~~TRINITY_DN52555_c0_g1_i1.p2  ORF type:complete len:105 (-),score=10.62 TRINITY_DN52555_c0_g1_i1:216-530(-)
MLALLASPGVTVMHLLAQLSQTMLLPLDRSHGDPLGHRLVLLRHFVPGRSPTAVDRCLRHRTWIPPRQEAICNQSKLNVFPFVSIEPVVLYLQFLTLLAYIKLS